MPQRSILKVLECAHLQETEMFILNGNWGSPGDLMAVEYLSSFAKRVCGDGELFQINFEGRCDLTSKQCDRAANKFT
jgi:hypothetical protein